MKCNVFLSLLLYLLPLNVSSQETPLVDCNEAIFNRYVEYITPYRDQPLETVLEHTAHFFIDVPYVAGTC